MHIGRLCLKISNSKFLELVEPTTVPKINQPSSNTIPAPEEPSESLPKPKPDLYFRNNVLFYPEGLAREQQIERTQYYVNGAYSEMLALQSHQDCVVYLNAVIEDGYPIHSNWYELDMQDMKAICVLAYFWSAQNDIDREFMPGHIPQGAVDRGKIKEAMN